jgi:hypothetical protein
MGVTVIENSVDLLDRHLMVNRMMEIIDSLVENKQGCCFAINGCWGSGKTFLLEMFEKKAKEKYIVFHYNCWENDFYTEPLVAIISSLAEQIKQEISERKISETLFSVFTEVGKTLFYVLDKLQEHRTGISLNELGKNVKKSDKNIKGRKFIPDNFDEKLLLKSTISLIRDSLKKISKETPIIITVDELDRCLPQYAITVLERLHHLFNDLDNVFIILSVDKTQLEKTVMDIYGDNNQAAAYLKNSLLMKCRLKRVL